MSSGESLVWAIDDEPLRNYLVPRECPRVTFYGGPGTAAADRERFLRSSAAVVAIESAWFERMQSCRLFCYHLPAETFECRDKTAGYLVSRAAVKPARVDVLHDPVLATLQRRRAASDAGSVVTTGCCHRIDVGVLDHSLERRVAATAASNHQ